MGSASALGASLCTDWTALPVWEAVAVSLPLVDLLSLRQGWRGAARLAQRRVAFAATARLRQALREHLLYARAIAMSTNEDAPGVMAQQFVEEGLFGEDDEFEPPTAYLTGFMEGSGRGLGWCRRSGRLVLPRSELERCVFVAALPGMGLELEATYAVCGGMGVAEPVQLEELHFPGLGLGYELQWALINGTCSVRSMRIGVDGYGRLQPAPLTDAATHVAALAEAAGALPSLRRPDGCWCDEVLLPACHAAVTAMYPLQQS